MIFDICYKNDELGDPLINDDHAVALGVVTYDELKQIYAMTARINEVLKELFAKMNINLIDFKIEFGRTSDGEIVLADEVSPDTCRLWDMATNEKLDKDRFRRDLGKVREAYRGDPGPSGKSNQISSDAQRRRDPARIPTGSCTRSAAFSASWECPTRLT